MKRPVEAMQPWGAIFDWDGVILDSSRAHERAWRRMAEVERRTLSPGFFGKCFGMKNEKIIPELLRWSAEPGEIQRLSERKEAFYREVLGEEGVSPLPGVIPWLQILAANQIPCAIASSTCRANIDCAIGHLGVRSCFQQIVTGDEVVQGKPDPAIFLLAARRLGIAPGRCVVFEDALVGVEAALAAGMRVVAVTTSQPGGLLQRAHRVVGRLDALTLAEVNDWFQQRGASSLPAGCQTLE